MKLRPRAVLYCSLDGCLMHREQEQVSRACVGFEHSFRKGTFKRDQQSFSVVAEDAFAVFRITESSDPKTIFLNTILTQHDERSDLWPKISTILPPFFREVSTTQACVADEMLPASHAVSLSQVGAIASLSLPGLLNLVHTDPCPHSC